MSECDDSDEGARLSEQAFVGTHGYIHAVFCLPTRALLHARKYSKIECCSFGVEIATIESRVMMSWDRELGRWMLNLARRKGSTHLCGTSRTLGGDYRVARRVYMVSALRPCITARNLQLWGIGYDELCHTYIVEIMRTMVKMGCSGTLGTPIKIIWASRAHGPE